MVLQFVYKIAEMEMQMVWVNYNDLVALTLNSRGMYPYSTHKTFMNIDCA